LSSRPSSAGFSGMVDMVVLRFDMCGTESVHRVSSEEVPECGW